MYHVKFATNKNLEERTKDRDNQKKFKQEDLRAPKYILMLERKKWEDEGMDTYSSCVARSWVSYFNDAGPSNMHDQERFLGFWGQIKRSLAAYSQALWKHSLWWRRGMLSELWPRKTGYEEAEEPWWNASTWTQDPSVSLQPPAHLSSSSPGSIITEER